MNNSLFYDIMYSIAGATVYSAIIYTGYRSSVKSHKRVSLYLLNLKEVFEEVKHIITKEENIMDKGSYKNTRASEMQYKEEKEGEVQLMFFGHKKEVINTLSLSNLLTNKPTDADYDEIIELLTTLAQSTYAQYDFLIFKSPDETKDTNLIQIVSAAADNPELHQQLFAKAMNTNIDYNELVKRFAAHIAEGNVIDIGDDVEVITNDGSAVSPTGVSQINNGLKGGDIAFIISFIKKENLDAFNENHLPKSPMQAPDVPVAETPQINE